MRAIYWTILLLTIIGCSTPNASPEKDTTLVIATDYIAPKDSILFRSFEKQHHVKIILKEISVDSLIHLFKKDRYNTGVDIVLYHHLYDMRRILQSGMMESLEIKELPKNGIVSKSNTFIGLGIDPFICVSRKDTILPIYIYDDLSKVSFSNNLTRKSEAHFYAPFMRKMSRAKTYNRMKKIKSGATPFNKKSVDSSDVILSTLSAYQKKDDSLWTNFSNIHYLNSSTSGVFHDIVSIGIIDQSSNYHKSVEFIKWITLGPTNRKFNKNRNYTSLSSERDFNIYPENPEKLLQYHAIIERMLRESR